MVTVCGLDPSGSSKKPTGIAVLRDNRIVFYGVKYNDVDIIETINSFKPTVVAIDSPLSFPTRGWFREVDRKMIRLGYRVLPPMWNSMKPLVERSIKIMKMLENNGIKVIETHPRSAIKSSNCSNWVELVEKNGIEIKGKQITNKDIIDAIIACIVALYYVKREAVSIKASDGVIYLLPRIC